MTPASPGAEIHPSTLSSRPSTVALADTVALLAGGMIAATGTHHELLATEPSYRELMSGETAAPGRDEKVAG